ncbi:MAG: hypothetical protein IJY72_00840, partial [Akkermansia sp.]|nr:hypothetical protein [Akkermansia sp.]
VLAALAVNGSFSDVGASGLPRGWVLHTYRGYQPLARVETVEDAALGLPSVRLTEITAKQGTCLRSTARHAAKAGDRFLVSFLARGSGCLTPGLYCYGPRGEWLAPVGTTPQAVSDRWRLLEFEISVPADRPKPVTSVEFVVDGTRGGTFAIADFRVERMDAPPDMPREREVETVLNTRDNIIVMVDEAHRTQEGNLGERMRLALPNAFFFGLTGTPINRIDKNTFATFGATEDRSGYMSKYSFSDSIRDGATLPLQFEPVPVELRVNREQLDAAFDEMTEEAGLTKEEKNELSRRVNLKAIMYEPKRIRKVCEHIVKHFREKIEPNGYKAQIVVYDRECCLMYKKVLDELVGEEASTIVMHTNNDKEDRYKEYRRDRDAEGKLLDVFRDPASKLKFVIVTAKLLTGFDAPVLQAMYLDKPMRDVNLLQAICRTNRTFDQGKTFGLIVDYIGIFDNVAKALDFDEGSMKKVITNIEEVKKQIPALLRKCLSYFMGVDRTVDGWEGLMAAQECLPTNKEKDKFAADYQVLNRAWNAI